MEAESSEVLPGVWRLRMWSSSEYVDHVNAYLLKAGGRWTLVDTGFPDSSSLLIGEVKRVAGGSGPYDVVLTHIHYDHSGGSRAVAEVFGCGVRMHPGDIGVLEMVKGAVRSELGFFDLLGVEGRVKELIRSFFERNVKLLPEDLGPVSEGERLGGEGSPWVVVHTPGHTPGHVCVLNSETRALISGDHLLPRETSNVPFYPIPGYNSLRSYLMSLVKAETLRPSVVLPAHGEPFSDVSARVDFLFEHHVKRLREALEAMGGWMDAIGLAASLTWSRGRFEELGPVDTWLAVLEALSHAEFLVEIGLAERATRGRLSYRAVSRDFGAIEEELDRLRHSRVA
ncbi:MAG: MBL fold metallo-hydrolase [Aigarchaeota archaeon]|nr:MBL fold metallo-hydrolase [Aigarchaeota archaeon]MCS7126790.1 MBL fold metallo-hydrolase [Candidatus Calditenuaceae archaeon]MDW8042967.1 MBL fold metallo-hydrolase [Nitrososphaerota archaeon]